MEDHASKTAVGVLAARALYTSAPPQSRIIDDPLAVDFLPPSLGWLKSWLKLGAGVGPLFTLNNLMSKTMGPGGASMIALRHRYIDDALKAAVQKGVKQVVILGAGFDSRAYRMHLPDVNFIEIDHPLTQSNKKKALKSKSIHLNGRVKHLAVDFQNDWLGQVESSGLIKDLPTYFIMEGVSYYLTEDALDYTFTGIKKIAPGDSKIMFDCFPKEIMNPRSYDPIVRRMRRNVEALGEPFTWGRDQSEIAGYIRKFGFRISDNINMQQVAEQLRARQQMDIESLPAHKYMYLVEAVID